MAKHLAMDENVQRGTVEFSGQKVAKITFPKPFKNHPSITITLEDSGTTQVPYRTKVKKNEFRIVFKNNHTGTVGWIGMGG